MTDSFPLPVPGRPVLIAGPTASGKSALALRIAQAQGRVVINADALQVHAGWQVLTAAPDPAERAAAPHHLFGHVPRGAPYSTGHWLREVSALLDRHPDAVIVGGTGLYFTALTAGLADIPLPPPEVRAEADALMARRGRAHLLADLDPATRARIDPMNPARVQRAWEVLRATGRGLADWQAATGAPRLPRAQATALLLLPDVDWLNTRIAHRFARMIDQGALDEVRAALPDWPANAAGPGAPPWTRAIGAPELVAHLRGHISLSQAIHDATLATRQYAKRQRTWFRNRMQGWETLALP
jgi:tRNA dimethylallyltransferase